MALHLALRGLRNPLRVLSSAGPRPPRARVARTVPEVDPLESRLLLYSDSPCGTWQQPSPPI
jgi:hypothetical protein